MDNDHTSYRHQRDFSLGQTGFHLINVFQNGFRKLKSQMSPLAKVRSEPCIYILLHNSFPKVFPIYCLFKQIVWQNYDHSFSQIRINQLKVAQRREPQTETNKKTPSVVSVLEAICHWPTGISIWTNKIMGLSGRQAAWQPSLYTG